MVWRSASPVTMAAVLDGRRLYARRADLVDVVAVTDPQRAEALRPAIEKRAAPVDYPGRTDAERNCISNVRPAGLCYDQAADKLVFLLKGAQALGRSGIDLKDDTPVANAIAAPTTAQLQK